MTTRLSCVRGPNPRVVVCRPRPRAERSRRTRRTARQVVQAATDSSAIASLEAFPTAEFFEIKAIIRPWRQEGVIDALLNVGVKGLTSMPVKGIGMQGAARERAVGKEYASGELLDKVMICVVTQREEVNDVVSVIIESARTGEIGDGKIFIYPTADVIRIRTKERGAVA